MKPRIYIGLILLVCFSVCNSIKAQESILDSLIAYYPLDGDARDLGFHCLNGIVHDCDNTIGINGKFLTALSFDGFNDYIEIPNHELLNFDIEDDYAISFWVDLPDQQADVDTFDNDILSKWVVTNDSEDYLDEGYPFSVRIFNRFKKGIAKNKIHFIQFGGYSDDCKGVSTLMDKNGMYVDGYNHIVINAKRGKLFLYVNGKLEDRKGNNVFCSTVNNAPLLIGKRGGNRYQNHFRGKIDNLAIYRRSLSSDEISSISRKEMDLGALLTNAKSERSEIASDTMYFEYNEFELSLDQKTMLTSYHDYLSESPEYHLVIRGHTNGIPGDDFCDELSLKRAKVVENYLSDLGVRCNQIFTEAMGKREQIAPNKTPAQRKLNQRVDFKLYYLGKS